MQRKLPLGKGYKGAEPTGCFNTGAAAVIMHSKIAKQYLGKPYAVGKEMDTRYNLKDNMISEWMGKPTKVKFFKTAAPAWKEFNRLNNKMLKSNIDDRKEIEKAKKEMKSGSMEEYLKGAHTLSDYGVL